MKPDLTPQDVQQNTASIGKAAEEAMSIPVVEQAFADLRESSYQQLLNAPPGSDEATYWHALHFGFVRARQELLTYIARGKEAADELQRQATIKEGDNVKVERQIIPAPSPRTE